MRSTTIDQSIVTQCYRSSFKLQIKLSDGKIKAKQLTLGNLRDKVAFNPFFFGSLASSGIKLALKAPGNDSKRDLSIPSVRI